MSLCDLLTKFMFFSQHFEEMSVFLHDLLTKSRIFFHDPMSKLAFFQAILCQISDFFIRNY